MRIELPRRTLFRWVMISALLVVFLACTESASDGKIDDRKDLLHHLLTLSGGSGTYQDTSFGFLGVDAELVGDKGSLLFTRGFYNTDTIYSFWAMQEDADTISVWAFGGVAWGKVGPRYYQLIATDSLGALFGDKDHPPDIEKWWDFAIGQRADSVGDPEGYPVSRFVMSKAGIWVELR